MDFIIPISFLLLIMIVLTALAIPKLPTNNPNTLKPLIRVMTFSELLVLFSATPFTSQVLIVYSPPSGKALAISIFTLSKSPPTISA